jgi:hypothetical protein
MTQKTRRIAVAVIALLLAALALYLARRSEPLPVGDDGVAIRPPAAVPYTFVWPEGAARGVDLPNEIYIPSIGKRLPLYSIADMRSETGEDMVAFLQRVRGAMVAYSDGQAHEACAQICSSDGSYSVRITSVGAVAFCAVAPVCLPGQASLQQSIHSHCPDRPRLRATLADEYLSGGSMKRNRYFGRCDPDRFSAMDFAVKPGWLAGVEALHRQNGPGDITDYPAP